MNWKKIFSEMFLSEMISKKDARKFIETQIIEKLIDDIPDAMYTNEENLPKALPQLKQQLKERWLK